MYESFFGLSRRPFSVTPDPDCCAGVETMQSAFDELCKFVDQGAGIAVLSAAAGTGKTLLCQRLAGECQQDFRTVFLANGNFESRRSFLQAVLYELGRPYVGLDEQELRLEFHSAANGAARKTKGVLLIVDEAHLSAGCVLDEIRSMTNLVRNSAPLARALLCGQMQIEERLATSEFDALNQRVLAHVSLEPISRQESLEYIEFRLTWAGGRREDVFSHEAGTLIVGASDGLARCINQLCDHSLLLAFASGERPVSKATVEQALDDLKRLPLQWQISESRFDDRGTLAPEGKVNFATDRMPTLPGAQPDEPPFEGEFSIEIGGGVEFAEIEIDELREAEQSSAVSGELAVFETGEPETATAAFATPAAPVETAGSKHVRPSLHETDDQAGKPAIARAKEVLAAASKLCTTAEAAPALPDAASNRRRRRETSSPRPDFWTNFQSPAYVEETVHVLATTRDANARSATNTVSAKDEVVADRYAAIDAVNMIAEKKVSAKIAPKRSKEESKIPGSPSSPAKESVGARSQASQQEGVLQPAAGRAGEAEPAAKSCEMGPTDVIVAVEEEIVSLLRETSKATRDAPHIVQPVDEFTEAAMERMKRARNDANRRIQPSYDVIQPVDDAPRKVCGPPTSEAGARTSAAGSSSLSNSADEKAGRSQSQYAQLFTELRNRRSG